MAAGLLGGRLEGTSDLMDQAHDWMGHNDRRTPSFSKDSAGFAKHHMICYGHQAHQQQQNGQIFPYNVSFFLFLGPFDYIK